MESSFAKEIVIRDAVSLEDCDKHTAAGNMQDESGLRQLPRAMLIFWETRTVFTDNLPTSFIIVWE